MHSVFDRAVNMQYAGGELYTLTTADVDNAPATLVTAARSFAGFALRPGVPVTLAKGKMSAGRLVVDIDHAKRWDPVLPPWTQRDDLLCDFARLLEERGVGGGIRAAPEPATNTAESQMNRSLARITKALEGALCSGDAPAAYRQAAGLVGLGGGLTPAGDDYLVGMCTAFALPGDGCEFHRQVLTRAVEDNAHRTNDISRAALLQAARGRVRQSLIGLTQALVTADRAAMPARAGRVLAIGHTSGTDIMSGLLSGLRVRACCGQPHR